MKIHFIALISYMLATPLHAQSPAPRPIPSSLDQQIASLKIDVPRIREITKLVSVNKDQPTKQIHDEFWGLILTRIHADPMTIKKNLIAGVDKGLLIQIAFWESLRLSAQSNRIVITDDFAKLRNSYAKAEFTSDYVKVQNAMLRAASTGQPYISRNGQSGYITVQLANQTLAGMNAIKARLEKLCDPNWKD
jgi:hypothetical protein